MKNLIGFQLKFCFDRIKKKLKRNSFSNIKCLNDSIQQKRFYIDFL